MGGPVPQQHMVQHTPCREAHQAAWQPCSTQCHPSETPLRAPAEAGSSGRSPSHRPDTAPALTPLTVEGEETVLAALGRGHLLQNSELHLTWRVPLPTAPGAERPALASPALTLLLFKAGPPGLIL